MNNNLRRLKEFAESLPPLPIEFMGPLLVKIDLEAGEGRGIILMADPNVSVHSWCMDAGTVVPVHSHAEAEWLIVYKGKMLLEIDLDIPRLEKDEEGYYIVGIGDGMIIPSYLPHSAIYSDVTELISVHIPRSTDYVAR